MTSPWLKRPDESDAAFAAFTGFRDLGPGRSLDEAWRQQGPSGAPKGTKRPHRAPGSWKRWKRDHDWDSRAQAYDHRNETTLDAGLIGALGARGEALADRLAKVREEDWAMGQQLIAAAKTMLERLKTVMTDEKFVPSPLDIVRVAELGSKLQRLAADMPTENTQQKVEHVSLDELTPEQLRRIAAGHVPDELLPH